MPALLHELRYAFRLLRRSPGFTLTATATLALAVGLNAFVFSLVNALLFRPLPVEAPHELVRIYSSARDELMQHSPMSPRDLAELRRASRTLEEIVGSALTTFALEDGSHGWLVMGEVATADYFETLGVEPALGRSIESADGRPGTGANPFGGASVAMLSHTAWQRRFGGDPAVVGRTLRLNGRTFTVVGVAPRGFFGLARGVSPEVWIPLGDDRVEVPTADDGQWLWLVGRRRAGADLHQVRAEVETVVARLRHDHPRLYRERDFRVVPSREVRILPDVDATLYPASFASLGIVGLVLLVACSNLAHLLLVRGLERGREITTRCALGAGRFTIVRQLLAEGFLLAVAGGSLGLLFAAGAGSVLELLPDSLPVDVVLGLAVDWRVVLFTLGASTIATLGFAVAPALEATRIDLATALRHGGTETGGRRRILRRTLVATQIALSLVLLIGAGLALRSLVTVHRSDPGFDATGVVVATLAPPLQGYDAHQTEAFYERLLDELRAQPETDGAALASHLPLTVELLYERVAEAGSAGEQGEPGWLRVDTALVGDGYFEVMGIPLLMGRPFEKRDADDGPPVAIVNRSLADRLWPGRNPLGQRLIIEGIARQHEVVGIVPDGKYRTLGEAARPFLYRAFAQGWEHRQGHAGEITSGSQTVVLKTRGEPGAALAALRSAVRSIDNGLAMSRSTTLAEATSLPFALPRLVALLLGVLALVGLTLVALGVAGVSAFDARRRTREIGIRIALGAERADILRLLLGDGARLLVTGLATGLLLAALSTRALAWIVYGLAAGDVAVYVAAALFLGLVSLLAGYLPARHAATLDPQRALRWE